MRNLFSKSDVKTTVTGDEALGIYYFIKMINFLSKTDDSIKMVNSLSKTDDFIEHDKFA